MTSCLLENQKTFENLRMGTGRVLDGLSSVSRVPGSVPKVLGSVQIFYRMQGIFQNITRGRGTNQRALVQDTPQGSLVVG